jgi:colanic acid biosynthesis glycosyl transferase WcaI
VAGTATRPLRVQLWSYNYDPEPTGIGVVRQDHRAVDRVHANLVAKGVPKEKIELIYDPATRVPGRLADPSTHDGLRVLSMGNIGHSQGLTDLIRAFEAHPELNPNAKLIVTGTGVAAEEARAEVRTDRVQMLGMVDDGRLEQELASADIAFVSQRYDGSEFSIPSKLMNFMAYGLPVLAPVNPGGEVAHLVTASGGGWVVDSSAPESFPLELARLAAAKDEITARAAASRRSAQVHLTQAGFAEEFEKTLFEVVERHPNRPAH